MMWKTILMLAISQTKILTQNVLSDGKQRHQQKDKTSIFCFWCPEKFDLSYRAWNPELVRYTQFYVNQSSLVPKMVFGYACSECKLKEWLIYWVNIGQAIWKSAQILHSSSVHCKPCKLPPGYCSNIYIWSKFPSLIVSSLDSWLIDPDEFIQACCLRDCKN